MKASISIRMNIKQLIKRKSQKDELTGKISLRKNHIFVF